MARRQVMLGAAAAVGSAMVRPLAAAPFEWRDIPPSEAGFASDLDSRLLKLVAAKRAWGLHGVLIARGGRIVLERYFEGEDNNWGQSLGLVHFGPHTLHNLYSVTKSVVALVYGVALSERKVPPPNTPLYDLFPEYKDLVEADPRRKERTIAFLNRVG